MKAAYRGGVRASTSPAKESYAVSDANVVKLLQPGSFADPLTEVLRNGARALLAQAIEAEVAEFLAKHVDLKTATGLRRVVRHGHLPEREVMTGIGPVGVRQPRVRDRGAAEDDAGRIRFTPAILPPYARRSRSLEVLIPILYLKGISTGDFEEALAALLGKVWPTTREQRCWVHKTANVLNKLPKSQQPKAKRSLQEIWMAETSKVAEAAFDTFIAAYQLKYDKAAECLAKDRQTLLAFYDFPAEHWKHLRTSNPIESTFATVRHRTIRSKGCLSNKTALAMVFKLVDAAQKSWRRLDGHNQLPKLIQGVRFTDGIEVAANPASSQSQTAAA